MNKEVLKLALEALINHEGNYELKKAGAARSHKAITAIKQALEQPVQEFVCSTGLCHYRKPQQEPVAWKWHQAPVKTSWGDEMVVADLAIDKDHTVSVYCERNQTAKVEAMFTPPAAQRPWVGLTDEEREKIALEVPMDAVCITEAKLKELNT
jgi:hypothetical protein